MSRGLSVQIDPLPLERVEVELVAAGYFADQRPLRGGAARADWRLCAQVSNLLLDKQLAGEAGEAVLLPSGGRLRAPRVLLLGLGRRASYGLPQVQDAVRELVLRATALGVRSLGLSGPGIIAGDFARHAEAILAGALEAMKEARRSFRLVLVLPPEEARAAARALEEAAAGLRRDVPLELLTGAPKRRPRGVGAEHFRRVSSSLPHRD